MEQQNMTLLIRPETAADLEAIQHVHSLAFGQDDEARQDVGREVVVRHDREDEVARRHERRHERAPPPRERERERPEEHERPIEVNENIPQIGLGGERSPIGGDAGHIDVRSGGDPFELGRVGYAHEAAAVGTDAPDLVRPVAIRVEVERLPVGRPRHPSIFCGVVRQLAHPRAVGVRDEHVFLGAAGREGDRFLVG